MPDSDQIVNHQGTEYLVVGETPDTLEKLELGDRLVLDGLAMEPDGEGYKVLADSPRFVEATDREADTLEALVARCTETSEPPSVADKAMSLLGIVKDKLMGEKAAKPMPFVLTERTWAHTDVPAYDIFARETDIRVWNFESPKNPLGGAVVGMPYEASHPFEVTDADGKERSVWSLKRGQSFTVEGGTHFNPTEGHRCRMKVLDTGKVTMVGRDPLEYDFRGQKLKGKYRFQIHDAETGTLTMGKVKMDEGKALGEGRGVDGPRQGVGGTDTCVCPECEAETKHERGTPCAEAKCPECGAAMEGKPPEEKKVLGDWAEELGQEAYKTLLDHAMETERLAEGEMALLAPEELEDLVGGWLAAAEEVKHYGPGPHASGSPQSVHGRRVTAGTAGLSESLGAVSPRNWSKAQQRKAVDELAKKTLNNLRKRQDLVRKQIEVAYEKRNTAALKNLQMMDRILAAAVDKREFGGKSQGTEEDSKAGRRISGEKLNLLKEVKEGFDALMEKMKEFIGWGEYTDRQETMPGDWASLLGAGMKSGFKSFKGRDGKWRWIAWAASAFEDRQQEFFKTKALERYVAEAYKRGDHGKLWFYHLPFAMGDADFTALPGESRILLKMGIWADDPFAQKAADYFSRDDEDWGASVGYKYKAEDREDREYDWLWVFETSPVPADKAAFPFSRFDSFGGKRMDVNEDQKAKLKEVFGEEWKEVLSRVESASKQLEEMGLAYKALQSEGDLMSVLGELLADEAIAEKAKANPVQMLKLALGKVKDEAAKGLIQKVIDALEKGDYAYPKPEEKAEEKEEYGKPKEKKAEGEEPKKKEDEEDEDEPKKGKKEADLPVQIEIEGLSEIVEAVKDLKSVVKEQGEEIVGLKAMLDASDDERAGRKLKKAPPVVAYKASVAGLLDDEEDKETPEAAKMTADHPLARLASGTPLGPRGG
jgi:hypothetical protein